LIRVLGSTGAYLNPELSPDEKRVAITRVESQNQSQDIWVFDIARGLMSRLTFKAAATNALWSPGGDQIIFQPAQNLTYVKESSGAGSEQLLFEAPGFIQDWSADGKFVITSDRSSIYMVPLAGDHKPLSYLSQANFSRTEAQLSSDGRWMAYRSNESGRSEIYIQSFPTPSVKSQISTDGGRSPRWRRDGKEIFYIAPDQKLMVVSVMALSKSVEISRPAPLFEIAVSGDPRRQQYDVTGDGQRFLVNSIAAESETPVTVVLNWTAGLKK
jgi:Tol biopolymer transport system component